MLGWGVGDWLCLQIPSQLLTPSQTVTPHYAGPSCYTALEVSQSFNNF